MTNKQGDHLLRGYLSSRILLVAIGIITPIGILVVNFLWHTPKKGPEQSTEEAQPFSRRSHASRSGS